MRGVVDEGLLEAAGELRDLVAVTRFPIDTGDVDVARDAQVALLDQLDDYVLPRLKAMDAPLLAVIGGSTGAGKSTLINSIVGATVSRSGVLRPTTRAPAGILPSISPHVCSGTNRYAGSGCARKLLSCAAYSGRSTSRRA